MDFFAPLCENGFKVPAQPVKFTSIAKYPEEILGIAGKAHT